MAPPPKRRRIAPLKSIPQELTFDPSARQEYLSGFSKRKTARKEAAREQAIKRDKEDRVRERAQLRQQRKEDLKAHVEAVDAEVRKMRANVLDDSSDDDDVEWGGVENGTEQAGEGDGEEEEEYVDEEKFTTVTVEPMGSTLDDIDDELEAEGLAKKLAAEEAEKEKQRVLKTRKLKPWEKPRWDGKEKKKKPKFRYETKAERAVGRMKQKNNSTTEASNPQQTSHAIPKFRLNIAHNTPARLHSSFYIHTHGSHGSDQEAHECPPYRGRRVRRQGRGVERQGQDTGAGEPVQGAGNHLTPTQEQHARAGGGEAGEDARRGQECRRRIRPARHAKRRLDPQAAAARGGGRGERQEPARDKRKASPNGRQGGPLRAQGAGS